MITLRFKPGTKVHTLDTALFPGLIALCTFMEDRLGVSYITITSVNDGVHKPGSLHYVGRAVDIRCRYYPPEKVREVVADFKAFYDADYDLLWENQGTPNEHLHLEYDPENENR